MEDWVLIYFKYNELQFLHDGAAKVQVEFDL